MAPAGTSQAIIDRLAAESTAVLTAPETRESLAKQGAEVATSTPEELRKIVHSDLEKWSKVIQEIGITVQ
jgi:tripartite-type tricarboxylate transporter receptor subunit TctC